MKGLSNFRKRRTIFLWCRKRKADLVFLQETHSIAATENQWRNEWGAEMISSHGSSNSRGVAILFKNGIDCSITHKIVDPEGRYIILKACIQDKDYVLINVYAPNKDKDQVNFFNNLLSILQNENLDSLDNIKSKLDLVDIWRSKNPDQSKISPGVLSSRLLVDI